MLYEDMTKRIISCAIEVHRHLGPGLLEGVYESALAVEFEMNGVNFEQQVPLPVVYKGTPIGLYRMDLVIEKSIVVELKSVERHDPLFDAQILGYMRLGHYKVGLLINFNSNILTKGVKRYVL